MLNRLSPFLIGKIINYLDQTTLMKLILTNHRNKALEIFKKIKVPCQGKEMKQTIIEIFKYRQIVSLYFWINYNQFTFWACCRKYEHELSDSDLKKAIFSSDGTSKDFNYALRNNIKTGLTFNQLEAILGTILDDQPIIKRIVEYELTDFVDRIKGISHLTPSTLGIINKSKISIL